MQDLVRSLRIRLFPHSLLVFPRLGTRRRLQPISRDWGFDRGDPIDRYYIARFLSRHAQDIHGRVLEMQDLMYSELFGKGVSAADALDLTGEVPTATMVGDLTDAGTLEEEVYDCIILTQTLYLIFDLRVALHNLRRALKPGGVLLVSVPGIAPIAHADQDEWFDQWRFTSNSARRLFEDFFGTNVEVNAEGNVLAATAFLYGLAAQELRPAELDYRDPDFEVSIFVRAVKAT